MRWLNFAGSALFAAALSLPLAAQSISSGSIRGTVVDPQNAVVPGAEVTLTNLDQNVSIKSITDSSGNFVFAQLLPARYNLTVQIAGFKKFEQRNVILNLNDSLSVGKLTLEVGTISQTVEVNSEGLRLQTEGAARVNTIVGDQLQNIQVNGRSPLALLRVLPGVVTNQDTSLATNQIQDINVNGARGTSLNATIDGVSNLDTGSNTKLMATISTDSIQEFALLASNYQAQYGKAAGGTINYVTRGGTSNFHGSAYWYYRDKGLNANTWMINRDVASNPATGKAPKSAYHYNMGGYTIGGPIYIPGKFNVNKDKLFFFFSEEYQRQLIQGNLSKITVPTALERQGDFSLSVDKNAAYGGTPNAQYIRDPLSPDRVCNAGHTGGCFADGGVLGRIPASRQYAPGIALLKMFPTPNVSGQKGYNYQWTPVAGEPRHERLIRIDYNLSSKWRLYSSFTQLVQDVEQGDYVGRTWTYSLTPNYPLSGGVEYDHPGYLYSLNVTTSINATSTNEATFGVSHHPVTVLPGDPSALTRTTTGVNLPTFYEPYADWIPRTLFNGTKLNATPDLQPGGGAMSPFSTYNTVIEMSDSYTKVWPGHLFKTGIYLQRNRKNQSAFVQSGGVYNFGDSSSNPLDTGFGFANAAAGVYSNFQQASNYLMGQYRYTNLEMYAQDTWRVSQKLSLDFGLRAYYIQPTYDQNLQTSTFWSNKFSPGQAVELFWPCFDSNGNKLGVNRKDCNVNAPGALTTASLPGPASLYIGKIVPNSGNLTNGILPAGVGINKYLMQVPGIVWAPRLGLALDITGRGNLVLRAGMGAFPDRYQGNEIFNMIVNPPSVFSPQVLNGFAGDIAPNSLKNAYLGTSGLTAIDSTGRIPVNYNFSVGIQAKLPWAMVLDTSYVGLVSRQQLFNTGINEASYGAAFKAENQDPTKWGYGVKPTPGPDGLFDGSKAYDPDFLRPFIGYNGITIERFGANTNYNSLQVTLDRRFAKGLFLGAAYTWSKCLSIASGDGTAGRIDNLTRQANYGPCTYDARQSFAVNYVYPLPDVASHFGNLSNPVTRGILNNWQISGLTIFRSGNPITPGFSISGVNAVNLTGTSAQGARVKLVGDPLAGIRGDPYNRLNAAAFAPPTRPSIGTESGVNYIVPPGINTWEMSLQKSVPLKERARLEFTFQAFNVFNHTQFGGLNAQINYTCGGVNCATWTATNLPYDSTGKLVNKTGFGSVSGIRSPRVLQLVARFAF